MEKINFGSDRLINKMVLTKKDCIIRETLNVMC